MPSRDDPSDPASGGERLATLNLLREPDGSLWLTVAGARPAIEEAARRMRASPRSRHVVPMAVLAEWLEPAVASFLAAWRGQTASPAPRPRRSRGE